MKFGRFDYAAFALFMAYAACSLAVPVVLVEVADDLGFSLSSGGMGKGGVLQLGRSIPMVAAMLVCGMCAGRFGLRRALGVAALLMACGIALAALSQWYWMLLAVLVVAGIGEGLVEGLGTPFVGELHADEEPGRYINFTHGFWSIGIFGCVPFLGWLLGMNVSWRWVIGLVALMTVIPAFMLLWPCRKPVARLEGTGRFDLAGTLAKVRAVVTEPKFWLFFAAMFFAGGGEFGLTFWSASLLRLDYGASAFIGGVGTAVFSAGMMLGRTGTGLLIRQYRLPVWIMLMAVCGTVVTAVFPLAGSLVTIMILLFLSGLASAPFWPSVQSYCVDRLSELDSTTLYILLSCAGIPGCGILTALMGKAGDWWGLRGAFLIVPVCYLLLAGLIAWDYFVLDGRRKMKSIGKIAP